MTNERAIELLNRISDEQFDGIHGDERREALEMALRALTEPNLGQKTIDCIIERLNDEDRTTDDLISREMAIDGILMFMPVELGKGASMAEQVNYSAWKTAISCAESYVRTMPSTQPELIEQGAYVRGFEQGRTQGMIDAKEGKK